MHNSCEEVDGPNGPQIMLLKLSVELLSVDKDLAVRFRCAIDDKIMQRFKLGKYEELEIDDDEDEADQDDFNQPLYHRADSTDEPEPEPENYASKFEQIPNNFIYSRVGFLVTDRNTGHMLKVGFDSDTYSGFVFTPDQGEKIALEPWRRGELKFVDDYCFSELTGKYWYEVKPSTPFSKILMLVESLGDKSKLTQFHTDPINQRLVDLVDLEHESDFVFDCVNGDLGRESSNLRYASGQTLMAYAYARRIAVCALYMQGVFRVEDFNHAQAIFWQIQVLTDGSQSFQDAAFEEAIEYLQNYNEQITDNFVKAMFLLQKEFEICPLSYSDNEFFFRVTMT